MAAAEAALCRLAPSGISSPGEVGDLQNPRQASSSRMSSGADLSEKPSIAQCGQPTKADFSETHVTPETRGRSRASAP